MIRLQTSLIWPGCAQGKYIVKAKGYLLAILRWGNEAGPLAGWDSFAYVPIDPAGNGCFFFSGKRGIPKEATHVWARCVSHDFSGFADVCAKIPERYLVNTAEHLQVNHFSILTDLHLSSKPWRIRQALNATQSDTIFLLGDSTNDGLPEQFESLQACIEETVPNKIIFPVTGNHDVLHASRGDDIDGCENYAAFQKCLLTKAEGKGYVISYAPDGRAYSVQIGALDVIGLQCVTSGRKFLFPDGKQIDWLEDHLFKTEASWHIILCHAPMLKHNPNRDIGMPYLDKDKRLQEILNQQGRSIFLSGHTHVSLNVLTGNGEFDEEHQILYLNCGSVAATDTSGEAGMMAQDWKDGCETELSISEEEIEICMRSIDSEIKFPRGYYRFFIRDK